MYTLFLLESRIQVVGNWNIRVQQTVPVASKEDEGEKILVNVCINNMERIRMRMNRK